MSISICAAGSIYFASGKVKVKNRAAARRAAGGNFAAVILDDLFADGKTEAGAMGLTMRGEGLEKFVRNFRRDAGTGSRSFVR